MIILGLQVFIVINKLSVFGLICLPLLPLIIAPLVDGGFNIVDIVCGYWLIERSFSWLGNYHRLWRNCERKLNTSLMMVSLAFIRLLLKRY
ncbi:hypothetical protein CP369_05795 [Lactobacillus sp. UMNPBX18]|nr:hypothetical protein CP369_05795 [Lactobacillus sp. UMNPBX18]